MSKKLFFLLTVSLVFFMSQKITLADFNADTFARGYSGTLIVEQSGSPAHRIIDYNQHYTNSDSYDAYTSETSGLLRPEYSSPPYYDAVRVVGMFVTLTNEGGMLWSDDFYFRSFLITPTPSPIYMSHRLDTLDPTATYEAFTKLSYDNGATRTSDGTAINLGIVYLYTQYALGTLYGYDYANNSTAAELDEALQFLLGKGGSGTSWTSNQFLEHLVTESGNPGVWLTQYDLNATYPSWVDNDYAVYVMNLTRYDFSGFLDPDYHPDSIPLGAAAGDILYLVKRDNTPSSTVPEPASLIPLTFLGMGIFAAARHRKKRA